MDKQETEVSRLMRAIVEGAPEVEDWNSWWAHHRATLEADLDSTRLLLFDLAPFAEAQRYLEERRLCFQWSDRYTWLDTPTVGSREARPCPHCGERALPILYGRPGAEASRDIEEGLAVMGGCYVRAGQPYWRCSVCRKEWPRLRPAK